MTDAMMIRLNSWIATGEVLPPELAEPDPVRPPSRINRYSVLKRYEYDFHVCGGIATVLRKTLMTDAEWFAQRAILEDQLQYE